MKRTKKDSRAIYPRLTRQSKTGSIGVEIVTSIINNQFEWLFRKVHQEEDFGIDGYVDIVMDSGDVTGQSIAVQIKSGKTFFSSRTKTGFVFKGELKHLNYYMNSPVPVLIILCDPASRTCYFDVFHPDKTAGTKEGWKMIIPKSQVLSVERKAELLKLVGNPVNHLPELEEHWAMASLMEKMGRILFAIDRADIESTDTTSICSFISRITSNLSLCEKIQGKLDISVSGYDADSRDLWEIPEVKAWFRAALPAVKYWFYFLTTEGKATGLKLLLYCCCEAEPSGRTNELGQREFFLNTQLIGDFIQHCFGYLNAITDQLHMPIEKNKQISLAVMKVYDWPDGFSSSVK